MDIHECFEDEGIETSKKRKHGPSNLPFDAKRKIKLFCKMKIFNQLLRRKKTDEMVVLREDEGNNDDNNLELEDKDDDLELSDE
ncbi:hypothetical protein QQP08_007537 [Theobroma cacao]|nr:hypothetical protein QQP08_007537 [Theobroma cacao]